ncbi:MAG: hypothetical protein ACR2GU_15615 [Rubrobacteraceae bacterium]
MTFKRFVNSARRCIELVWRKTIDLVHDEVYGLSDDRATPVWGSIWRNGPPPRRRPALDPPTFGG